MAIIAVTLALVDVVCITFGIFPPVPHYGDPDLGWRGATATGHLDTASCTEYSTGQVIRFARNEDGVRTGKSAAEIRSDKSSLKIAVTGDSQTDLCAVNGQTHSGVLEAELNRRGIPVTTLTFGEGRYSPLQDYLAYRKILSPYRPDVLVINLYTGNDFFDILRVDDRPHFVVSDSGYRISEPTWFIYDDPRVSHRSRVLFVAKSIADRTGVRGLYLRVKELNQLARAQGRGLGEVLAYLGDIRKATEPSLGYPQALAAQMLNQQIFFRHFPDSRRESFNRLRFLMRLARRENPGVLLVMSPLPSYVLTGKRPMDEAVVRTLARLGVSPDAAMKDEESLYEELRSLSAEEGWLFVDNLAALRADHGSERIYNGFDYHFLPAGSAIIGREQAAVLYDSLHARLIPHRSRPPHPERIAGSVSRAASLADR